MIVWFCVGLFFLGYGFSRAEEPLAEEVPELKRLEVSHELPPVQTTGGFLVWQDVRFYGEWRIQYNTWMGYYRLLDPQSVRYAFGTLEACEKKAKECDIPPVKGRVLVLLHGLGSNRLTFQNMAGWFRQRGGYDAIVNITYPSLSVPVAEEAKRVGEILRNLEGAESFDLVGHSLGAIILRCYLGHEPDKRVRRFVQLCPPNQGSGFAGRVHDSSVTNLFSVSPLGDLSLGKEAMLEQFGVPKCPFAIIAGGKGDGQGFSKNLPGDDDAVISVATTHLAGAEDFLVLPWEHAVVPNAVETFEAVARYLDTGSLRADGVRNPL
ncbi:MAG: hypothetical protein Q4D98_11445 [Planctomycetia bacterium]|nr:hypothetical protein [Planctomycetia bacterium]